MKKKILAALVLALICAGGAMAATADTTAYAGRGPAAATRLELTPEQRAAMDEMRRLHSEMRAEFQKEIPNKAKLRELHKQEQKLKNEMDDARFEYMLKNPEKFKKCPSCGRGGFGPGFGPGPRLTPAQ